MLRTILVSAALSGCSSGELAIQRPELVCPDGSGNSSDSSGKSTTASSLFGTPWSELLGSAGTGTVVMPADGAHLSWDGAAVALDWSPSPERTFLLGDCATPAVGATVPITVTSPQFTVEQPGQVWISGDSDPTVVAWSAGGKTPVPDEWVTAVASLDVAGPPDELTVLFSLNTEIVSGVAPGPMWAVHGLWNRDDGVLEDEHELDRGAWVVQ